MPEILKFTTGADPDRDAWMTNFYTENHLAYEAFPEHVASPEQLNFIVHMGGEPLYYPCSDDLFAAIVEKQADTMLTAAYKKIWNRLERLVREVVKDEFKQKYLLSLLSIKYQHETSSKVLLPARLEKRLLTIFTTISEITRPLAVRKETENRRVTAFLERSDFLRAFNSLHGLELNDNTTLDDVDLQQHVLRLQRLLVLSTVQEIWQEETPPPMDELERVMNEPINSGGWQWTINWLRDVISGRRRPIVLWIGGRSGEIVFDLAIIHILQKIGIKVIMAVKQGFYYHQISFVDLLEDPILGELLAGVDFIGESAISKNELLTKLSSSSRLLVISDGTREQFNPLMTSVTFARAFKEADLIISRCPGSRECISNHFLFTRDLVSIVGEESGKVDIVRKPHHPEAIRFPESALRGKAEALILSVKMEKDKGKAVMFYSAIVGSIPGQLGMAKQILNVFVQYLRSTMHDSVIINPGEHFEWGMDADDIMYMWEIFQRSGVIDIWRFQTMSDIEKAFEQMGEKVPPEWTGKDATYSTGCTKEMEIAMDIQNKYPEMQLIGPSWEKFQRRQEYGVGKLYDRALAESK
ncbi:MAG: hypothetical protein JRF04_02050 [Deltaproteobacteria bacterium]|nr:hypothetical protein [Deltaproteobacteria bacterium]